MAESERTTVRDVSTCTAAFDVLNLFVVILDLSAVVDVGSNPTSSTASRTLVILQPGVVSCSDSTTDSCRKGRKAVIFTVILISELARVYSASINCVPELGH